MQETLNKPRRTAKNTQQFRPKNRIEHAAFGLGTIVEIDDRYTTIAFDESGTRKFMTSMIELAHSDVPRPANRRRTKKVDPTA